MGQETKEAAQPKATEVNSFSHVTTPAFCECGVVFCPLSCPQLQTYLDTGTVFSILALTTSCTVPPIYFSYLLVLLSLKF